MSKQEAQPYSQVITSDPVGVSMETSETDVPQTKRAVSVSKIDVENARFPCCIVWTPLPLIGWFLPCIGHTGIGMSNGIIHDFAGPYTVTVDDLAFGETHKYVKLDIKDFGKFD